MPLRKAGPTPSVARHRKTRLVPGFPANPANDLIAVVIGLLLHLAFILTLHDWLIGVRVV